MLICVAVSVSVPLAASFAWYVSVYAGTPMHGATSPIVLVPHNGPGRSVPSHVICRVVGLYAPPSVIVAVSTTTPTGTVSTTVMSYAAVRLAFAVSSDACAAVGSTFASTCPLVTT